MKSNLPIWPTQLKSTRVHPLRPARFSIRNSSESETGCVIFMGNSFPLRCLGSSPLEHGRPLLEEGGNAFTEVLGAPGITLRDPLIMQRCAKVVITGVPDTLPRE